jgi:1,4-dihydroxy-2-naphthoate octaprenyltransferase
VVWLVAAFLARVAIGAIHRPALAVLVTALPATGSARTVLGGARGRDLVPVLKMTGSVLLLYGVLLGAALSL